MGLMGSSLPRLNADNISTDYTDYTDFRNSKQEQQAGADETMLVRRPRGLLACCSCSLSLLNLCNQWMELEMRQEIERLAARHSGC